MAFGARGPEFDPRPVTSYPCLDFSPFYVALNSFKYPQNGALMEREKGKMNVPVSQVELSA